MKGGFKLGMATLALMVAGVWLYLSVYQQAQPLASSPPSAQVANTSTVITNAPLAPVVKPVEQLAAIKQQLEQLAHCEQYQQCPQGKTDAYEGEYLRLRQMADLLGQLTRMASQQPQGEAVLRQVASDYLAWPDGHVQSAALSLLSALPAQSDSVKVITVALRDCFDAPLMRQAMQELQRYPANDEELQGFFGQILQTGSMYTSQEVAQGLLPFLTADNLGYYRQVLAGLDPRTTKALLLQATLKEFGLQQSQG